MHDRIEPEDPNTSSECDDRGVRWALIVQLMLLVIVFGVAGFCFYECSRIASAEAEFHAALGGKPLPHMTEWLLQYRSASVMLAAFVPCAALATFALRDRGQAIGALFCLIALALFHAIIVHVALWMPTVVILKKMGTA